MTPETPSDPPRQFVELASGPAAYTDVGEGPVVVAVHGLPGSVRDYRWLGSALEPHLRFVRIDMAGFGETPLATEPSASIRARADFVRDVITALEIERPLLIGHSLGGVVVADVAARCPSRLSGLGLLASVAHRPHRMIRGVPRRTLSAMLRIPGVANLFRERLRTGLEAGGFKGFTHAQRVHTMHCLAAVDFRAHAGNLAALRVPTLVAWTEDDSFIERQISEELYWKVPMGPRIAFAQGGHNLQKTRSVELAESIRAWVRVIQTAA